MKYHAGCLSKTSRLQWIKTCRWPTLPTEIKYDLDVTLSTPGFSHMFWAKVLGSDKNTVAAYRKGLSHMEAEGIENWNSITSEDARALAKLRHPKAQLPLVCRIHLVTDVNKGMTWAQAAREYRVTLRSVCNIIRNPFGMVVPQSLQTLIPAI